MRMELVERRVLGAVHFIDAVTRSPVREFVRVESAGARLVRNRQAHYVIWEATGLEPHTTAFEMPPTAPPLESLELALRVMDAGRSYLPRAATIRLPRDPNPANASAQNSLFRPIEIALLPSPAAATGINWAVLHATVLDQATDRPLPGALIRVLRASDDSVLARGMTDWRGRVVGEALVAVPGIPVTTFASGEGPVTTTQVDVTVEALFDPLGDWSEGEAPDPDDLEARRAALRRATVATQLSAGQRRPFFIQYLEFVITKTETEDPMPEYLAPGVYVEETSFRAKSIEGVGTSTTAFVGPTRKGPVGGTPEIITSFGDFERVYGGLDNLALADAADRPLNYLAHAVRNYFDNGGSRLYVSRAYLAAGGASTSASAPFVTGGTSPDQARFVARFPGEAGDGRIAVRQVRAPATVNSMNGAPEGTMLRVTPAGGGNDTFFVKHGTAWNDSGGAALSLTGVASTSPPGESADFLTIAVVAEDGDGHQIIYDDLGFDSAHPRWIGHVLAARPSRRTDALQNLFAIEIGANVDAFELRTGLFTTGDTPPPISLTGGSDGNAPTQAAYEAALAELEKLEDVAIVAAPGHSAYAEFQGIQGAIVIHAEKRRAYRIAVLDTPAEQSVSEAQAVRSRIDSKYAALYYPWVVVGNPLARPGVESIPREISLPPSGFVCGIYARNDVQRGVHKVPANEVVLGTLRFESDINFAQQEVLNPLGVNCLRFFSGRGYRLWGGRTVSSDPEWKYVNVRRYFNFLESSIDRGTQWAVFESNGERLWANIRDTISSFLYNEWANGALLGSTPKEAFFVRCDRSTMTQNDLDNGRLVCLIGVAVLKPAEFVIFRIGQKTADSRS